MTTIKNAENAASRLAHALGKEFDAQGCWKKQRGERGELIAKVGCWTIDNDEYGGVVINEISNEGGGVHQPFGYRRRKPEEFVASVNMAIDAVQIYKEKHKRK